MTRPSQIHRRPDARAYAGWRDAKLFAELNRLGLSERFAQDRERYPRGTRSDRAIAIQLLLGAGAAPAPKVVEAIVAAPAEAVEETAPLHLRTDGRTACGRTDERSLAHAQTETEGVTCGVCLRSKAYRGLVATS